MGALQLSTKRTYTFKHKDENISFSLKMTFPSAEDIDYSDLDSFREGDGSLGEDGSRKITIRTLRQSIVSWTGIEDTEGKPLEVNEESTRAVMDEVLKIEPLFKRILNAYAGLSSKN